MTTLTPLETQLLAALKLRRATSWPFVPPERGGLGLTAETAGGITEHQERNRVADEAVERAIAAAEGVVKAAIEAPDLYVAPRDDGRTQTCMEIMAKDLAKIPMKIVSCLDSKGNAIGKALIDSERGVASVQLDERGAAFMKEFLTMPVSIGYDIGTDECGTPVTMMLTPDPMNMDNHGDRRFTTFEAFKRKHLNTVTVDTQRPMVYVLTEGPLNKFHAIATMTYPAGTPTCQARAENDFRKCGYIVTNRNVKSELHAKKLQGYKGPSIHCVSLTPDTTP